MKTVELKHTANIEIKPKPPYNFDATIFKPSHYPDPLKIYEPKKYWFAMRLNTRIYGIKMEDLGSINKPKVKVTLFSSHPFSEDEKRTSIEELDYRFEFSRDISTFSERFKHDKVLSPFLKKWCGMHGSCAQSLYGLLMISIFLQNTVVKRTVRMTQVMLEKYGIKAKFDGKEVFEFWKPEEMIKIPEEELRSLKVGYRAKLIIKLSETYVREKVNEFHLRKMSAPEVKKTLIKLYGVGPETARISLQEAFHHYDTFEHIAPWQQKIYSRLFFNKGLVPAGKIIKLVNSRYGEWAVLAAHCIWEDIFWQRKQGKKIDWLEKEIKL